MSIKGTWVTSHVSDSMYLDVVQDETVKVYLTAKEIVSYGVVERERGQPKVTVEDVIKVIGDLRLRPYAARDDQPVYDPVPIREALDPRPPRKPRKLSKDAYHRHIAAVLRDRIESGVITGKLPTQRALAAEFKTVQSTVSRAISLLKKEGIVTVPRKGVFVAPKPSGPSN